MAKTVYIESSIPSYLAARPSRDLIQAARQQITHTWWSRERLKYNLVISQTVIDEVQAGDPEQAKKRIELVQAYSLLAITPEVDLVVHAIMQSGLLPQSAVRDAIHIGVSSVHAVDILLTWNCRHIANAAIIRELQRVIASCGYETPILCTPEELLESE